MPLALGVALGILLAGTLSVPVPIITPAIAAGSTMLPFDLPSAASLHAGKQVFAHYVPWYPLSLDNLAASTPDYYNKNYLAVNGENGKYAAHGGLMRDRPSPRPPVLGADWRVKDMETEIRRAQSSGLDGFVVSIPSFGNTRSRLATNDLIQAAQTVGNFTIMLRPNMISGSLKAISPAALAKEIALLGKSSAVYRLPDRRLVVSPFMAEAASVTFWQSFISEMKTSYQEDVAFWPMFLNEVTWGPSFKDVSYGEATWGERTAANNDPSLTSPTSKVGRVKAVHDRGSKWMQPVSLGDARPAQSKFYEPQNSENLRRTWAIAIASQSDMVHIPTWNDFAEGSQIGPSEKMGWAPSDINSYYLTWYKTGSAPTIVRDAVYVSNRKHLSNAPIPYLQVMKTVNNARVYDDAEALIFLTAPATVTVSSGARSATCEAPAGVSTCRVALATGAVKAKVVRSGRTVSTVESSAPVTASPAVQDMDYIYTSSLRSGTSTPITPTPTPTPTTPTSTVKTVAPVADTYVNAGAPDKNSGTTSSMVSRGDIKMNSYLRFDLPVAPAGMQLTKASLAYWVATTDRSSSTASHSVWIAGNSWSESTVTFRSKPAVTTTLLGTITGASAPDTGRSVSLVASKLAPGTQVTLSIQTASADDLRIWSKEFAATERRPYLNLTYTKA